ncbi:unnamed protein product, partial [Litomosoides sigmodontis]
MFATWSLITDNFVIAIDDSDYEYLSNDFDENGKPADVFWGDVLDDDEPQDRNDSSGASAAIARRRKCSTETVIMDKLLNGTGYSKYRLP